MTIYTETANRTAPTWPVFAALGAGVSLVLVAVGTLWDLTGNDTKGHDVVTEFLVVGGVVIVVTLAVFGLVVRTATEANAGRRALALAVLSLLTLVVFWSGLPAVLAFASAACALRARRDGTLSTVSKTSLAMAAVALALAVYAAIAG